ncbi:LuxR C-terminal-related transcriptional regulator [Nocardia sp. NPDC057668]|uniref:helix-turn-helix transcriptional regulator n=1 Tax=Nocardia sp. NPDC057668 TaxID=3346202 RepID=UPI003673559A
MRFLDRAQALDALRRAYDEVAAGAGSVVALTIGGEPGLFVRMPDSPADGLAAVPPEVAAVVQPDVRGAVPADLAVLLPDQPAENAAAEPPAVYRLSARQRDVADLLCAGLTNAEIADSLVLSVRTVDHHVSAILRKLGVRNRRAARTAVLEQLLLRQGGHPGGPRANPVQHGGRGSRALRSA